MRGYGSSRGTNLVLVQPLLSVVSHDSSVVSNGKVSRSLLSLGGLGLRRERSWDRFQMREGQTDGDDAMI